MSAALLLASLLLPIFAGLAALVFFRSPRLQTTLGVLGPILSAATALIPTIRALAGGPPPSLKLAWQVPNGAFSIELDALSAFFLLPVFGVSAIVAVYGGAYLLAHRGKKPLGPPWFFFNVLISSMALVVVSRNAMLFLVAWEVMSLASYFLVTFEKEDDFVQRAGWIYLVATHIGMAFLLVFFITLGQGTGSLEFDRLQGFGTRAPALADLAFLLALAGFGMKAGLMPFHVWLPEAHPAAPSHVSAVMSGVMIKIGVYGLLRALSFVGPPAGWWGWLLIGLGLVSGILGILQALSQADLKRMLAYSSVENMGIIALGLGVGLIGIRANAPVMAVLGFVGALLHVLHHSMFKSLLFLCAGAVLQGTHTRNIEALGGLLKRMPSTGLCFVVAATAIVGLPPLNGFVSELVIYLAALAGARFDAPALVAPALGAIGGLALIGGLAAAAFAKAFGVVFLGEPRTPNAAECRDPGPFMRGPMIVLAAGCVFAAVSAPFYVGALGPLVTSATGVSSTWADAGLAGATASLGSFLGTSTVLAMMILAVAAIRRALLARHPAASSVTWDCGYVAPSPRMQYTSSSFAQPIVDLFQIVLRTKKRIFAPLGIFPKQASLSTSTPDVLLARVYEPAFRTVAAALGKLHWLQQGRIQVYILYILVTLVVLLVWRL